MRVQLTTDRVGPVCTDSDGDIIDVDPEEARRLIASGQAIPAPGEIIETNMFARRAETLAGRGRTRTK